jgi:hypothetical protein
MGHDAASRRANGSGNSIPFFSFDKRRIIAGPGRQATSTWGQKQTLKRFHPMSALPPIADIRTEPRNVRLVPKSGHRHAHSITSSAAATHASGQRRGNIERRGAHISPPSLPLAARRCAAAQLRARAILSTRDQKCVDANPFVRREMSIFLPAYESSVQPSPTRRRRS